MKNLTKALIALLSILLVLSFAACGQKDSKAENTSMNLIEESKPAAEEKPEATEAPAEEDKPAAAEVSMDTLVADYFSNMPDHIYKIGEKEFVEKVSKGDEMVILDIRGAKDYDAGHIKGAINLPWGPAISDNLSKIPQDKEVFIYCYTGQTAGQAVMTLNIAGINARSVNLGWNSGISKVEGVDAVTETTASSIGSETYAVNEAVQKALNDYYAGLADVGETKFKNYKVSEDDLKAMIDGNEDFYLLSVRKAEDYAKGHIKGAQNVPFGKTLIDNLGSVPKDKKVVVYCYTGQTAGQTTAAMRLLGYDAVSLNGGVGNEASAPHGWINKGHELVTE